MSTTTPTTGVTGTGSTYSTTGSSLAPADNGLGQNQFLMLMMDQLKAQDPLSPSDPTQYLSELASFTSLEQETKIASSTSAAAGQQSSASALALLGHTVSYTDASGVTQSGAVTKVNFASTGPVLTIGSQTGVSLGSVTEVS